MEVVVNLLVNVTIEITNEMVERSDGNSGEVFETITRE